MRLVGLVLVWFCQLLLNMPKSLSSLTHRARPVITVVSSIFLPASINITAPQCHDGQQPVNCLNVTACFSFHGRHVPGEIGNEPTSEGFKLKWACGIVGSQGVFSVFRRQQAHVPDAFSL